MRKKILGALLVTSLALGGFAINGVAAEGEKGGIPTKIEELKVAITELANKVEEILPLKDEVTSVKEEVVSVKETVSKQQESISKQQESISNQQESIDLIDKEVEDLKSSPVSTTPDGQQVQQRLSFDNSNWTVVVSLIDRHTGSNEYQNMPVPDRVLYLFEENDPDNKLVGITDFRGKVVFNVIRGKKYIAQFKGDDKYKPIYGESTVDTSSWAKYDHVSLQTRSY